MRLLRKKMAMVFVLMAGILCLGAFAVTGFTGAHAAPARAVAPGQQTSHRVASSVKDDDKNKEDHDADDNGGGGGGGGKGCTSISAPFSITPCPVHEDSLLGTVAFVLNGKGLASIHLYDITSPTLILGCGGVATAIPPTVVTDIGGNFHVSGIGALCHPGTYPITLQDPLNPSVTYTANLVIVFP